MKKIIFVLFAVLLCSISTVVNAQNYTGSLVIYVDGVAQPATQNAVEVTKNVGKANLKISAFKIQEYSAMAITLNSTWNNNNLVTPASISISPLTVSLIFGKLTITDSNIGTLTDAVCNLDLKLYSPTLKQNVRVVFNGTVK